jgi:hypothetical protein
MVWCLESYSPVQPAKDVSRTNSRQIPDKFQTNSRVWKSLENSGKLGVWDFPEFPRLFQTLGFVWNLDPVHFLRLEVKFQTNPRVWKSLENSGKLGVWDFPDFSRLFQTLGFVWNVSGICLGCVWNVFGICRLEVVWDLSDICLESLILVPRGTPGIVRDSNDREVLTE